VSSRRLGSGRLAGHSGTSITGVPHRILQPQPGRRTGYALASLTTTRPTSHEETHTDDHP
jgi:hypothetical protein